MENTIKRIIATATTFLLALTSLVAVSAPAQASSTRLADVFNFSGGTINTYVGEAVNWDWMHCDGYDATQLWFDSGSLPTGLSWDNGVDYTSTPTGAVTGTPTEAGTWTMTGLHCNFAIGDRANNQGGGTSYNGSITVIVSLQPSPVPTISLTNYGSANCEYEINFTLPEAYAPGSVRLTLTNGTSTGDYILYDFLPVATPVVFGGSLLDNSVLESQVHTVVSSPVFTCGDNITATIYYTATNKSEANASASAVVDLPPSPAPSLSVNNLDDNQCNVEIFANTQVAPKPGTAKLVISTASSEVTVVLIDNAIQNYYNMTLSMYDLGAALEASNLVSSFGITEGVFYPSCEQTMNFSLTYQQEGHAKATATQTGLAVSRAGVAPGVTLAVTPRGNDFCEVDVTGTFATQELANSVKLTIESQTAAREITLVNYLPGQEIYLGWSPTNADSTNDPHIASNVGLGTGQMSCGEPLTFTLSYFDLLDDGYYGSQPVNITPTYPIEQPSYLTLTALNDEYCNIRVTAAVPIMAEQGTLALMFAKGEGDFVTYQLRDYAEGELIDFVISTNNWNFQNNRNVVSTLSSTGYQPNCNESISAQLTWSFFGNWMNSDFKTVFASQALPWPSVSVTPLGGQNCLVAVTVHIPQKGNQLNELMVGNYNTNEGSWATFSLTDVPLTPFTVIVPMSDLASTQDSHISGTPRLTGTYHCGSLVEAQVHTQNDGEDTVTSMPQMEPQTSYSVCNLGTYHLDGNCVLAPVGTFVNTLNADAAISCPAGLVTFAIGATSPNDCYKPVTQIVKGLKVPKALKFKVKVGLPVTTNSGLFARVSASGSCTVETVRAGTKVSGKKVKVATAVVTTTSVTGICTLTFANDSAQPFTALNQIVKIKVNKKGK